MKKKKSTAKKGIGIVVALLIGVALGILTSKGLNGLIKRLPFQNAALSLLFLGVAFYLSVVLQVILHEAGHLLGGLWTGYTFSSFRIFSFTWVKLQGKIRLKRLSIAGTAGQCLLKPPALREGKLPVVLYNLGGVLMNVFASAIAVLLYFPLRGNAVAAIALLLFAVMGGAMALTNGIPLHISGLDNDGANAFALRKNEKAIYAFWVQMQINATLAEGVRLKDMPEEWFSLPDEEDMGNGLVAARAVFRANYLIDKHAFAEAKTLMEGLLNADNAIIGVHNHLMRCDLVYVALLSKEGEVEKLWTKSLASFRKSMKGFPSVIRTEYAYALLHEKKDAEVERCKKRFKKAAKRYPYAADIQSDRELMALAEEKVQIL